MRNQPHPVSISEESLEGFATGQITVDTVPMPLSGVARKAVTILASKANTGPIYVGGPSVSIGTGYELSAGDSVELKAYDLSTVYVVAAATQLASWVAV